MLEHVEARHKVERSRIERESECRALGDEEVASTSRVGNRLATRIDADDLTDLRTRREPRKSQPGTTSDIQRVEPGLSPAS